jgi:hypothetical protein
MTLEELRWLASFVEPLPTDGVDPAHQGAVVAFNSSVSRFRELVVRAHNTIVRGHDLDVELLEQLRILANDLPGQRRQMAERLRRLS